MTDPIRQDAIAVPYNPRLEEKVPRNVDLPGGNNGGKPPLGNGNMGIPKVTVTLTRVKKPDEPPLIPGGQDDPDEVDCRIYWLVVLGRILQGFAVIGAVTLVAYTVVVSPWYIMAQLLPLILWTIGGDVTKARLLADNSVHIPGYTRRAFIPGQPVGLVRPSNFNCCFNAPLQMTMFSKTMREQIELLPDLPPLLEIGGPRPLANQVAAQPAQPTEQRQVPAVDQPAQPAQEVAQPAPRMHPLKVIMHQYFASQDAKRATVRDADPQSIRKFIASIANQNLGLAGNLNINENSLSQEDGGEVFGYFLQFLADQAAQAKRDLPAYCYEMVSDGTGQGNKPYHKKEPEVRFLLPLTSYMNAKRAKELPTDQTEEQLFLNTIVRAYMHDQNEYGAVVRKFVAPPKELFLQFNRYDYITIDNVDKDGFPILGEPARKAFPYKINDDIPTPFSFQLPAEYCENGESPRYEADSFLVQKGGMGGGHYVACLKTIRPDGRAVWWEVDDGSVKPLYKHDLDKLRRQGYNFHYVRVS
jgi:hypothetical protein